MLGRISPVPYAGRKYGAYTIFVNAADGGLSRWCDKLTTRLVWDWFRPCPFRHALSIKNRPSKANPFVFSHGIITRYMCPPQLSRSGRDPTPALLTRQDLILEERVQEQVGELRVLSTSGWPSVSLQAGILEELFSCIYVFFSSLRLFSSRHPRRFYHTTFAVSKVFCVLCTDVFSRENPYHALPKE
jgi:hypothetical protein